MNSNQFTRRLIYKSLRVRPEQDFARFELERSEPAAGEILLRNLRPAPNEDQDIMDRFDQWAETSPDHCLVSRLLNAGEYVTYGDARRKADALARALMIRGLRPGAVIATIVDASCNLAIFKLACLRAAMVHVPIARANLSSDLGHMKIDAMLGIGKPDLVLTNPGVSSELKAGGVSVETFSLDDLLAQAPETSTSQTTWPDYQPSDLAAIYFTSGSTGLPKGVQITRRMISAVQSRVAAHWPFLTETRPMMADWLPWHHVFGGLDNFFKMVWNGGSYFIRPVPRRHDIAEIAEQIAQLQPTVYTDVPFGISLLLDHFEERPDLLQAFLGRLQLIFFAGAGMDGDTWKKLNKLIPKPKEDHRSPDTAALRLASGYGSTESGSTICLGHERPASPGEIGIPLPNTELRLVETDGRLELRVRGPHVSPGYVGVDGQRPMPLDDQGFLMTGDTVASLRANRPETGMVFDGRLAEDFKLTNGTRVKVGALRQLILSACSPFLADVAIAGESRPYIGVLLFPSKHALSLEAAELRRALSKALAEHNICWPGSSMAIRRAVIQTDPANAAEGEINDKGQLVQRRTLKRRAVDVKRLFAASADDEVIDPSDPIP
ncbi:MAG: AMP-binding protein [Rhodobacter sp.]|nr:AMP-binding protein [Rhodobacter sp.]MCY4241577.1 AMP-binding protein [Rhodobacter sp.]